MALTFDPSTGLVAPSTAEIRADVAAMFVSAFTKNGLPPLDTAPETPAGQLIDSIAAIIADKDAELLYLANMFNPLTAEGVWQAALGQIYFLAPTTAKSSVATCTCTGLPGTVIGAGTLIQSTADGTQWVALDTASIGGGGTVQIDFQCQAAGEIAASAGTLTKIVTVTPGWDSVTNTASAVVGTLAETQLAFEKRRYNSVAINARGSINALYSALSALEGVIDLAVLENNTSSPVTKHGVSVPGHSVYITIVGGSADDIAGAIYRNKDAGCGTTGNTAISYTDDTIALAPTYNYYIERPDELEFGVTVTIRETDSTPADIEQMIKDAVVKNFVGDSTFSRAGAAQTIYSSRFYGDIIACGANDLVTVTIGTFRSAVCTITGTADTVIPAGSLISCTADSTQWALVSDITIPAGGTIDAQFLCTTAENGSVAAGTLTTIVNAVTGWSSVTNAAASTVGRAWTTQIDVDADEEPVIDASRVSVIVLTS